MTSAAACDAPFLEVSQLCFDRQGKPILEGVSFAIARHEIVCLLGHSGSGKTSILRLIAGLAEPSSGRIVIGGDVVAERNVHVPPQRRGVGLIFQDFALFPHLTVRQNVAFGARGLSAAEQAALTSDLLETIGLGGRGDAYPHMLSGGEQQRVALARALASRPRIVLMDEPFSSLDQHLRRQVADAAIALLRERGVPALMVTHDPQEAMRIADRIILLEQGCVLQEGTPADLYAHPHTLQVARFFSELNELPGTCRDGQISCPLGRFAAPGEADGPVTICWRPQDIVDEADSSGVECEVSTCRPLGDTYAMAADLRGSSQRIVWSRSAANAPLPVGTTTRIVPQPGRHLIFPRKAMRTPPSN